MFTGPCFYSEQEVISQSSLKRADSDCLWLKSPPICVGSRMRLQSMLAKAALAGSSSRSSQGTHSCLHVFSCIPQKDCFPIAKSICATDFLKCSKDEDFCLKFKPLQSSLEPHYSRETHKGTNTAAALPGPQRKPKS